ncbi:ABC transporter substrate-binding protein [Mesorhizobium sp. YM1C-6-2]|uniref:ABC transporter substrate-binding protein n=1 Tax=Mesorhizobium sp. YM1C-6-2 TaxID=1827501 RepID=UPI000EF25366|nr:ABC transporter substrate-binding protein [Mesorhizobium sp. YM1C-6-2]RLP22087.1 ABC transporter substrate-binding protein [Mesorhizobium sp. YM1C-6-2]
MKIFAVLLALLAMLSIPARADEAPLLAELVKAGTLPPEAERLPKEPRVMTIDEATGRTVGKRGGTIRTLMSEQGDLRLMTVYGYARLVAYNRSIEMEPDILLGYENDKNRVFTFHLRPGHKWSDGTPFTAEDFRYQWEDILTDKDMERGGLDSALLVNGKGPKFEVIDDLTVRYTWEEPNPLFLPALASARPLDIYSASAYLKQFHAKYADPDKLAAEVAKERVKDWTRLNIRKSRSYRFENPDLPTLQPWQNKTYSPANRYVFERNPYYHRVDQNGAQLPYVDQIVINIAESSIIPAKTGSGESDLQERYLSFADYTFLKEGEKRNNYTVRLWTVGKGAAVALYPNLNTNDAGWRALFRDARFRRALSLGIDRTQINQVLFMGLAKEGASTVLPGSPLFRDELGSAYAEYDPEKANALLDEIGLKRNAAGIRLMPDGRPLDLIIESTGESSLEADVLELVTSDWADLGVKLLTRTSQRDIFRSRVAAGETNMSVWAGVDNGAPTADFSPQEFVPTDPYQLQWPMWGTYVSTQGDAGQKVDDPAAQKLVDLYKQWLVSEDIETRKKIWEEILDIHADQVFSIGIVTATLVPVVVSNKLHNVPAEGISSFDPYGYFGVYEMDAFWMD